MSISILADETPIDPDDEMLVAYLDGELPRDQRTQFENRLLDEPGLRTRLQQLQTGWDLLENLPAPTPNARLVETTLELAVHDLVPPPSVPRWGTRYRHRILVVGVCLAAAVFGLAVDRIADRVAFRRQIRELAIAEDLDAYNDANDLDLMRQLQFNDQFNRMVVAATELNQTELSGPSVASVPIDERESAIAAMPIERRTQLYSRWERYERLDDATKKRIGETADAVAVQSDREALLKTMRAYAIWREGLPAEMVDAIEASGGDERAEAIRLAIDRTMVAISERSSRQLSDDTIERIYFVLKQILAARVEKLPAEIRSTIAMNRRIGSDKDDRDPEWMALNLIFGKPDRRRSRSDGPPILSGIRQSLQSDETALVRVILPESDLAMLERSTGGDPLLDAMVIRTWAEEAVRRKAPWPRRENTSAMQRYLDVPAERRDELDLLDPKEILNELSQPRSRFSF